MCFTGNDGYKNFLVFSSILSALILDGNENITNWISTRTSFEKVKPFDINLKATMSDLANGRVILKSAFYFHCTVTLF